jgi:hypothetical protein
MNQNFIDQLFLNSIHGLCNLDWEWPQGWSTNRKLHFLQSCMKFAETREMYEECAIIRDVEREVRKEITE